MDYFHLSFPEEYDFEIYTELSFIDKFGVSVKMMREYLDRSDTCQIISAFYKHEALYSGQQIVNIKQLLDYHLSYIKENSIVVFSIEDSPKSWHLPANIFTLTIILPTDSIKKKLKSAKKMSIFL